jgi:hypothetical protein
MQVGRDDREPVGIRDQSNKRLLILQGSPVVIADSLPLEI